MHHLWTPAALIAGSLLHTTVFASGAINLRQETPSRLAQFIQTASPLGIQLIPRSAELDENGTLHMRIDQFYQSIQVWGADAVVHVPNYNTVAKGKADLKKLLANLPDNATMNGIIYDQLAKDLKQPSGHYTAADQKKALATAKKLFAKKNKGNSAHSNEQVQHVVFIDEQKKAHWAYKVQFIVTHKHKVPQKPNYILDATTFNSYQYWDNIQTSTLVDGGGMGGNTVLGEITYSSLSDKQLTFTRDDANQTCYLQNTDVFVSDVRVNDAPMAFVCPFRHPDHGKVYWSGYDPVNGAYSPSNDALYTGQIVKNMYKMWYNVPALVQGDSDMPLHMRVHMDMENAYWDGSSMTFGDGGETFYPLVSLGVAGHEIAHGFTEQHSNLYYYGQSGGLNESFSDMAAQATEFFEHGSNSWEIGPEIFKISGLALRYMDQPSKDCYGGTPGYYCSIDNLAQYDSMPWNEVHWTSGLFNHLFYLMGTTPGWDAHKAFNVMVKANRNYWTATSSFKEAACGVLSATHDLGYRVPEVVDALKQVGFTDNDANATYDIGRCE
jgi:pseudolysin